jgi:VWFA-related protein
LRILVTAGAWLLIMSLPNSARAQAPNSSNQSPYTLQVDSRVVLTDVTVTDKQGNPVTGLAVSDFQLFDNGKPQKLASFEEHRQRVEKTESSAEPNLFSNDYLQHPPAQVNVLLFDTTTIAVPDQMYLFQQMKLFVDLLPVGTPVAVFRRADAGTIQLASFTDDHATLMSVIGRAIPRLQPPGSWMASELDTLRQIAWYLRQIPGRKNLLWFTGGSNLFLGTNPMAISMDPGARRAIYDMLESERIAIYPIDARGLTVVFGRAAMVLAQQQMQMQQDATATGGTAYVNTNGLALTTQHILTTDGDYYTLSYTPNNLKNNSKWHRVEVKLDREGHKLSYRHGFFDDRSNRSRPAVPEGKAASVLQAGGNKVDAASDHGEPILFSVKFLQASPVAPPRASDYPLKYGEARYVVEYSVPAKEVRTALTPGNSALDKLGTAVFVYDQNGELVSRRAMMFTLDVDEQKVKDLADPKVTFAETVNLPYGHNDVYLGVWDMATARMGTVNANVEVKKTQRR